MAETTTPPDPEPAGLPLHPGNRKAALGHRIACILTGGSLASGEPRNLSHAACNRGSGSLQLDQPHAHAGSEAQQGVENLCCLSPSSPVQNNDVKTDSHPEPAEGESNGRIACPERARASGRVEWTCISSRCSARHPPMVNRRRTGGFVSGHDFSRAESSPQRSGLQPLRLQASNLSRSLNPRVFPPASTAILGRREKLLSEPSKFVAPAFRAATIPAASRMDLHTLRPLAQTARQEGVSGLLSVTAWTVTAAAQDLRGGSTQRAGRSVHRYVR